MNPWKIEILHRAISKTEDETGDMLLKKGLISADLWVILSSGKKLHYGSNVSKAYDHWKSVLEDSIPEKSIS
jgi:hypothetical protein